MRKKGSMYLKEQYHNIMLKLFVLTALLLNIQVFSTGCGSKFEQATSANNSVATISIQSSSTVIQTASTQPESCVSSEPVVKSETIQKSSRATADYNAPIG